MNLLLACAGELWALDRVKLAEVVNFLLFKANGGQLNAQEVEARISQTRQREVAQAPGAVAVLPISGMLVPRISRMKASETGTPLDALSASFSRLVAQDTVKTIVLDVDSPGGLADGVPEFADEVFAARGSKPIIAQINTLCCSAAYWIASQADEMVVSPSGRAGSIGVYSIHDDISKALEAAGVKRTIIKAGANKALGDPSTPLSDDARASIERQVTYISDLFTKTVARGRGVGLSVVEEKFGQGDVFTASDLVKRGMVDRIAPMTETLGRFGVGLTPSRRTAATQARSALAMGRLPAKSEFEAFLREVGTPKNLATALASGGIAKVARSESAPNVRSESAPGEAVVTTATLDALKGALGGALKPSRKEGP